LHFIIYIGCGIALLLLLITIIMLIIWRSVLHKAMIIAQNTYVHNFIPRKTVFEYKINWIHLHFAIVLVLALIVFMAGIETATDHEVGILVWY